MIEAYMNKRLCKLNRHDITSQLGDIHQIVAAPKFLCRSCARSSSDKNTLCKPAAIPSVSTKLVSEGKKQLRSGTSNGMTDKGKKAAKRSEKQNKKALKKQKKVLKKLEKVLKQQQKLLKKHPALQVKFADVNQRISSVSERSLQRQIH
ncbi:hypothetical protein EA004_06980 [Vibrio anguillarum]|uniref:Uncharacterized protein n=1 Tax=Vibrio anguillarum TaxID=55601 RepID=A0ABR9Z3Q5_VIBAN|nr:hypothetical protein [Vibrio anguillarum]MBF4373097.1 hypothetical protein [Vibrio anguillarum]